MKTKTVTNSQGHFIWQKYDTPQVFTCDKCHQLKKSKTTVVWQIDDIPKTICNGCFGNVLV